MWAAERSRNPEIITILLNAGANARLQSKSGMTAAEYAEKNSVLLGTKQYKVLKQKASR